MSACLPRCLLLGVLLLAGALAVRARPGRPRNPHWADDRDCHARTLFPRLNPGSEHYLAEYDLSQLLPNALQDSDGKPCHTITAIEFELMDEGAITLARALHHNTDVHTIYLHYADIGDEGAEAIAELLRTNQALHTINLGHNAIENEGAEALASALKENHGLHTLTLDHNKIKEPGIRAMIEALKVNEDLLHLNVHSNHFNLQSPPHARILEQEIEGLIHGHAFHHFHTSGEVEDRTELHKHAPHAMDHINAHREKVRKGADGHVGSPGMEL